MQGNRAKNEDPFIFVLIVAEMNLQVIGYRIKVFETVLWKVLVVSKKVIWRNDEAGRIFGWEESLSLYSTLSREREIPKNDFTQTSSTICSCANWTSCRRVFHSVWSIKAVGRRWWTKYLSVQIKSCFPLPNRREACKWQRSDIFQKKFGNLTAFSLAQSISY